MANPSKAKGTRFESGVVEWMKVHGCPTAERRALSGAQDKGDLTGVNSAWVFELKNQRQMDLSGWIKEAQEEMANAGAAHCCVIHHHRGKPVAEAYVTMTLADAWSTSLWLPRRWNPEPHPLTGRQRRFRYLEGEEEEELA